MVVTYIYTLNLTNKLYIYKTYIYLHKWIEYIHLNTYIWLTFMYKIKIGTTTGNSNNIIYYKQTNKTITQIKFIFFF